MYNLQKRDDIINIFTKTADTRLEVAKMYGSISESMVKDDASMVKFLVKKAFEAVAASIPTELDVADVAIYINMSGDGNMIRVIDIALRNKYSSNYEFKFKGQVIYTEDGDVFDSVANFLKCSYIELISDAVINANLEEINAKFAQITEEAGNTFAVKVVSPLVGEGKKIVSITDDEVVFVADETRVLSMDDIVIFCEPTEILSAEVIEGVYKNTVATFAQAQTTAQFVGLHEPTIGHICDISKLVKAISLIKKVYSKNAEKLGRSKKDTVAYFMKDGVYSVVSITADGKDVILKPFNVDTLEVVDYDVVANI